MSLVRLGPRLFLSILAIALGLGLFHWIRGHPQDVPWTPLSLGEPVGRFTHLKIRELHGDFPACRRLLADGAEAFSVLPPLRAAGGACGYGDGVRLETSAIYGYAPRAEVSCPVAIGLFLWERQVLQPAALRHFGRPLVRVETFGSYACRPVRGGREGRWSEHARANAIDIAGFRLSGGRRISVAGDWDASGSDGAFLREVRDGACGMFATVLSPDYNAAHRDHLHFDQADRGGWSYCR